MKKKIILIIVLVVLLAVLIGAYILYDKYSEEYTPDNLVSESPQNQSAGSENNTPEEDSTAVPPQSTETPSENPAPDFTVLDAELNEVSLSDYIGKPVVLNFWATWCPYCISEMPEFEQVYGLYGEDVQFMMVNVTDGDRETVEKAQEFIAEQGFTFPVYYDTSLSAAIAYNASSLPVTYFIGADGEAAAYASGAIGTKTLLKGVNLILN